MISKISAQKYSVRLSSVSVWLVVKLSQRLNNAMMQLRVSEYLKVTRSLMIEMSQQQKSKLCCCKSQFQEVHAEQKRSEGVQIGLSHSGRLGRRMVGGYGELQLCETVAKTNGILRDSE